ncbi:hypothetical protein ACRCPG_33505, partial [Pseudomonas aeruginosa]
WLWEASHPNRSWPSRPDLYFWQALKMGGLPYGWASGFVHGQWGAMRDSNFTHCLNPLHRFHRVPLPFHRKLEPTLDDGLQLVNSILDDVSTAYPGFNARIKISSDSMERQEDAATVEPT